MSGPALDTFHEASRGLDLTGPLEALLAEFRRGNIADRPRSREASALTAHLGAHRAAWDRVFPAFPECRAKRRSLRWEFLRGRRDAYLRRLLVAYVPGHDEGRRLIVNPATVLATRDDVVAMDWIRGQVPSDARFLINVRHWQGGTYVGTDGGYWIPLLTGRDTVLPSAIYTYGYREYAKEINDLAEEIIAIESFDEEGTRQLLSGNGVTHVYIGARGGSITPQMLIDSSYYRRVYSNGAVWIFQVLGTKRPPG